MTNMISTEPFIYESIIMIIMMMMMMMMIIIIIIMIIIIINNITIIKTITIKNHENNEHME